MFIGLNFPHISQHQREVVEHMAQGLGDQALANLLSCPPEQHVPQLEQFEKFVLGQRMSASEGRCNRVTQMVAITSYIGVVHRERDQYH